MKISLNPSYELFRHVKASGQTAGSTWWLLLVPAYRASIGVTIIVLPSDFASHALNDSGKFYFSYTVGKIVVVSQLCYSWSEGDGYPQALEGALYLDVASVQQGKAGASYLIDEKWVTGRKIGEYDRWFSQYRLNEEQAIARCVDVAEDMCRQMFVRAEARRSYEAATE